ncbi:flagellar basal body P-ring formation protein FlgA [bacterium]|nr:flagellar basal body P-ring formation protein FlgA [bacterium]
MILLLRGHLLRLLRAAEDGILIILCLLATSAWAVEDQALSRKSVEPLILEQLSREFEPLGFSDIQIRFLQFPEKFSHPAGAELRVEEMAGHKRLGVRRYKISALGERGVRKTAFCAAAVSAEGPDIRARYHIPAGKRIAESDLQISRARLDDFTTTAATAPSQIVGQEANRNIAQGGRIDLGHVRQPFAVQRGEIIEVELDIGGVQARVFGEAQSSGFVGDRIPFKNTLSLQRFFAKITGPRQAQVAWAEGDKE